jgi:hypothetical protein
VVAVFDRQERSDRSDTGADAAAVADALSSASSSRRGHKRIIESMDDFELAGRFLIVLGSVAIAILIGVVLREKRAQKIEAARKKRAAAAAAEMDKRFKDSIAKRVQKEQEKGDFFREELLAEEEAAAATPLKKSSWPWACMSSPKQNRMKQNKAMWTAVMKGDVKKLEEAIDAGADVNWHHPKVFQMTSLHIAAADNQVGAVKALIAYGADVNARNKRRHTPLMSASIQGHVAIVGVLIDEGADLKLTDKFAGNSAIEWARIKNKLEVVNLLNAKLRHAEAEAEFQALPDPAGEVRNHLKSPKKEGSSSPTKSPKKAPGSPRSPASRN